MDTLRFQDLVLSGELPKERIAIGVLFELDMAPSSESQWGQEDERVLVRGEKFA